MAASADPVDAEPSPFFMTRLRGRLAEQRPMPAPAHPFGRAAVRLLPVLAAVVAVVVVWAGVEARRSPGLGVPLLAAAERKELDVDQAMLMMLWLPPGEPAPAAGGGR